MGAGGWSGAGVHRFDPKNPHIRILPGSKRQALQEEIHKAKARWDAEHNGVVSDILIDDSSWENAQNFAKPWIALLLLGLTVTLLSHWQPYYASENELGTFRSATYTEDRLEPLTEQEICAAKEAEAMFRN